MAHAQDHFSSIAKQYAAGRIGYPGELFEFLASLSGGRDLAWDCATGSGQAAVDLAKHFSKVAATDVSAELLALAPAHPRIRYETGEAERSPLADASVDLVTIAQALHWFDLPRFWIEVRRVLKPAGVCAFWGYTWPEVDPAVDAMLEEFKARIAQSWPERSALLHRRYADVKPPFEEIVTPAFTASAMWSVDDYLAHLASWSATRYYRERTGEDVVAKVGAEFRSVWASPVVEVRWPLALRVFRKG